MLRALCFFLFCSLAATGCGHYHAGGPCNAGEAICNDSGTLISCEGGVFEDIPCRGPDGCYDNAQCDASLALDGDRCGIGEDGTYSCAPDLGDELQCQNGFWVTIDSCPDGVNCTSTGDTVSCQ